MKSVTLATLAASLALITPATATCDPSTLNTTTYYYPITEANTTVFDVARITKRGVCDISRQNPMAGNIERIICGNLRFLFNSNLLS
ncbi:hypothetical protein BDV32DRAFT_128645 [Aspergillus pseudonomiae]|nr:hypothetical protein BDV32DRAFT_128645 [Aspergillus pseudonomiae]